MPYSIFMVALVIVCLALPGCNAAKRKNAQNMETQSAKASLAQEAAQLRAERALETPAAKDSPAEESATDTLGAGEAPPGPHEASQIIVKAPPVTPPGALFPPEDPAAAMAAGAAPQEVPQLSFSLEDNASAPQPSEGLQPAAESVKAEGAPGAVQGAVHSAAPGHRDEVDALAQSMAAPPPAYSPSSPPPPRPVLFEEPEGWRRKRPALIFLHEAGSSPEKASASHGLLAAAQTAGVLLVLPQGSGPENALAWNAGPCCGPAKDMGAPDLQWLGHLIDSLPSEYKVDKDRIYLAGQGNGAMMAYRAACAYSGKLAGLAVVGGPMDAPGCQPAKPLPVLHIHSMEDFAWPYFGGEVARPLAPKLHAVNSAIRSAVFWARSNGCSENYTRFTQGSAIWERFENCPENTQVTLLSLAKDAGTMENPYAKYPVGFKILEYFGLTKEWGVAKKNSIDVMPGLR